MVLCDLYSYCIKLRCLSFKSKIEQIVFGVIRLSYDSIDLTHETIKQTLIDIKKKPKSDIGFTFEFDEGMEFNKNLVGLFDFRANTAANYLSLFNDDRKISKTTLNHKYFQHGVNFIIKTNKYGGGIVFGFKYSNNVPIVSRNHFIQASYLNKHKYTMFIAVLGSDSRIILDCNFLTQSIY